MQLAIVSSKDYKNINWVTTVGSDTVGNGKKTGNNCLK